MAQNALPKTITKVENAQIERERLTSLINSMADGVMALDQLGKVIIYNAAVLSLLDRNTSLQGLSVADVLPLIDKDRQPVDILEIVMNVKAPQTYRDYRFQYKSDSSIINLFLSVAPVYLGYGKSDQGGFVILLRDITREKSLEEERDEFISVASHELRTPVAISEGNVSNALFVLKRGGSIAEITKALETTHQQIMFLTDLINDLSTLSRAESGKLPVNLDQINCHDLVVELENSYKAQVEAKGLKLITVIDPNLEILNSTKLYVKEILQNFITNSLKYTTSGTITISAKPLNDGIMFSVADTGIGISKADQSKVFTKFFRSEDFRTRQSNGTGLGLYVTEKLANLIHAKISLESVLNQGSTFSLYVPNIEINNHGNTS